MVVVGIVNDDDGKGKEERERHGNADDQLAASQSV